MLEETIFLQGFKNNKLNFFCIKLFDDGITQAIYLDSKLVFFKMNDLDNNKENIKY